jgi:hypothetical protein
VVFSWDISPRWTIETDEAQTSEVEVRFYAESPTRTRAWLFPGGRPGQPIGDDRLGMRRQNIGLHPRQARSTALFILATELPAAILARMLGIHIQVAVQWQKAAAGDWMTYAADVSRRIPQREGQQ